MQGGDEVKKPTAIFMDEEVHTDLKVLSALKKLSLNAVIKYLIENYKKGEK